MYKVNAARSRVRRELRQIPKQDLERIGKAVNALAEEPRPIGAIQLEKDIYRIRVGNYRVIYKVYDQDNLVLIGRVVRRSESTYDRMNDLFD
jgi:mRNA interferase RelE/StbE